jgi:hypothetical protein
LALSRESIAQLPNHPQVSCGVLEIFRLNHLLYAVYMEPQAPHQLFALAIVLQVSVLAQCVSGLTHLCDYFQQLGSSASESGHESLGFRYQLNHLLYNRFAIIVFC